MEISLHKHLRVGFMLAYVVAWNVILGVGVWMDRGANSFGISTFAVLSVVVLLGTSLLCLGVIFVPAVRAVALKPSSDIAFVRRDLWTIFVFCGAMGLLKCLGVI